MARPVWSGTISFGMVAIPVRLVSAVRRRSVSFNQLDAETMSRIRYRKISEATGEEVPPDRIVRAANLGGDNYVVVTEDELAALAPERSREIVIESFVPAGEIDPMMYDSSFHVTPDALIKPYALLASVLEGSNRLGIGRFVMRQREHLAAIRSVDGKLRLSTMVFADELVSPDELDEFDALEQVQLSQPELDMARTLLEAMSDAFHPERYADEYRAAVDTLIEDKAAGQTPVRPAKSDQGPQVVDLAEALEASLNAAQTAKGRHPSSGTKKKAAARKQRPRSA
jgi:DNA end-binding protein Ku